MANKDVLRIGAGAGTSDDRIEPALDLAERGELDYLVFECLAERTIARENLTRMKDPEKGYTPSLLERMRRRAARLPASNGVRIVTNMGAANPLGARARRAASEARELGLGEMPVAVVIGDDVTEHRAPHAASCRSWKAASRSSRCCRAWPPPTPTSAPTSSREALATGAPIVMTGRVADPSLFLGADAARVSAGATTTTRSSRPAPPRATCWNAPRRSPAAASPTRARRTCPTWRASAFRSPTSSADGVVVLGKLAGTRRPARRR